MGLVEHQGEDIGRTGELGEEPGINGGKKDKALGRVLGTGFFTQFNLQLALQAHL
jgi:hypothetical protein